MSLQSEHYTISSPEASFVPVADQTAPASYTVILPVRHHRPFCILQPALILWCTFFVSFVHYPDRDASLPAYGSILYPAMQATH